MRMLALIACLLPFSAQAGDDLQQAEKYFKRLEYRQAVKAAENVLNTRNADHKALVSAYRMQGLCFAAIGKTKKSVAAFSRLLAIEPSFRLSKLVSPKLSPPFYQALGLASDRKPISLSHEQPKNVKAIEGLRLTVTLEANPFHLVAAVRLRYRVSGSREQQLSKIIKGTGLVEFSLPEKLPGYKLKYYFEALNRHGGVLFTTAASGKAFEIKTTPKLVAKNPPIVAVSQPPLEATPAPPPAGVDSTATAVPDRTRWYNSWWFWTAVGVVVAGAATGTAVALTSGGSSSGPYHYGIEVK
ncbi:MAG TPA: tetratricopeptide repeat protein [Myxococcota bacterium]|nr:tetratricopeptide repeat protein [Myxococcota bacterium]